MKQSPRFDPKCDRQAAICGLSIQLGEAQRTGRIPAYLGPSEAEYNGIQNPSNIVGRPRDQFDAIRMQEQAQAAGTVKPADDGPSGSTEPAPASSQE